MQQDPVQNFSCFLIGSDTLLVECGKVLVDRGHSIRGVLTDNPRVEAWALSLGLKVGSSLKDPEPILSEESYDYLFSVTHLRMISPEALRTPRRLAINFHDGPLPRYAGLNAPAWALMNRETQYGITWHEMTARADEGAVLEQVLFDIAEDETSLSLNTRCFAAALESFGVLIDRLSSGQCTPQIQDFTERSYFARDQKPALLGVLDFHHQDAQTLEALVRALDFGPYFNPLAAAKWVIDGRVLLVTGARARPSVQRAQGHPPGEILEVDDGKIAIQTLEGSLEIHGLASLAGEVLEPHRLAVEMGLETGALLQAVDPDARQRLEHRTPGIARSERFWLPRLERFTVLDCPYLLPIGDTQETSTVAPIELPGTWAAPGDRGAALLAGLLAWIARICRRDDLVIPVRGVGPSPPALACAFSDYGLLGVRIDPDEKLDDLAERVEAELAILNANEPWLRDVITRSPALANRNEFHDERWAEFEIVLTDRIDDKLPIRQEVSLSLQVERSGGAAQLQSRDARIDPANCVAMAQQIQSAFESFSSGCTIGQADILGPVLRKQVLEDWNRTRQPVTGAATVDEAFQDQVRRTPDRAALHFEGHSLSYADLDHQANGLAHRLVRSGVRPGDLVGIYIDRSLDLPVAVLAALKVGAAYVPLDPSYPRDRIAFMIADSGLQTIITRREQIHTLPATSGIELVRIDQDQSSTITPPERMPDPKSLCYVIYTSGSTGQPKGVMVEHRNVINFFQGMDQAIARSDAEAPGVWFAVTSLSFDISVLELLWTLARGFEVVIYLDRKPGQSPHGQYGPESARHIDFGLFYWGNDDGPGRQKYHLLMEGARFADENGFVAVWTPERHFHAFGGPYPNPAITGAAVAATTQNLEIRSGSCVLPLHDPIRVAEEWAVLDNLSNGRVALGVASGWQPNDFVLAPSNFEDNKSVALDYIERVRKLWRGEEVLCPGPLGEDVSVSTQPRPVQAELPIWMTTAGNPESYRAAARTQANVLTHLLGQSLDEVGEKIAVYRETLREEGLDPEQFKVTLMLHTFVGDDTESVRERVREPMKEYLGSSVSLVKNFAWAFPAFKKPEGLEASAEDVDLERLSAEELDAILDHAFERYFETSGLFGDVERCVSMIERCKAIGVDEIACLIDYGVETEAVIEALPRLKQVLDRSQGISVAATREHALAEEHRLAEQFRRHRVTHFQSTPSMAKMLLEDESARKALAGLKQMLVGGEACPLSLARELKEELSGELINMYGPTETTIWSATHAVEQPISSVPIGRPIANTQLYVLDSRGEPVPPGVPGELYIAGEGVVRGYLGQPDLTKERFRPNPFSQDSSSRMYQTGDLVRQSANGLIHFLGRTDHQVKIRGHRIELGEIEARLTERPEIKECVATVREDIPGDPKICVYWIPRADASVEASTIREGLRSRLPDYMIPSHIIQIDHMPLTPNGKIDRKSLPSPSAQVAVAREAYVEPANEFERILVELWQDVLGLEQVGTEDNFFDIGGHSLLVVKLHREIKARVDQPIALTDLYRFTTIGSLSEHLSSGGERVELSSETNRAKRRRDALAGRRRRRGR